MPADNQPPIDQYALARMCGQIEAMKLVIRGVLAGLTQGHMGAEFSPALHHAALKQFGIKSSASKGAFNEAAQETIRELTGIDLDRDADT